MIVTICSICGLINYASMFDDASLSLDKYISINESLEKQIDKKDHELSSLRNDANNYYVIKNKATNLINSNFFATQTVLIKPHNTRAVFYISIYSSYNIGWIYSNGITATSRNNGNGLVYLDVTYDCTGVEIIECSNSINNSIITIYCIGN